MFNLKYIIINQTSTPQILFWKPHVQNLKQFVLYLITFSIVHHYSIIVIEKNEFVLYTC